MKKYYQSPNTNVVRFATTDIMQLAVGSGELPSGAIGNAPRRKIGDAIPL
jgi:hypothetical protein